MESDPALREAALLQRIQMLKLDCRLIEHLAVMTVDEALEKLPPMDGYGTKNLFLRDGKGQRHFLVVVPHWLRVDLSALARELGASRLGMGSPERLLRFLGIAPGAVGIFSLFNDSDVAVESVIDARVWQAPRVLTHTLRNTATASLSHASLERFLESTGHVPAVLEVPGRCD
ncbi:prolyl-tRNA synthetase associated domain-containing protein [Paludibacterium yongneupense]|uniref:prolyl-tRNA synthetase associated domain-containing protein n=1 Tax=Paludibacterium yongneupense TaxID=400061 RepID=UPI0004198758|nr:prolyl-tRNA synthetase associated domain-containing protein [Paludibacterium yongneupense]